jgi:hypothetical protein
MVALASSITVAGAGSGTKCGPVPQDAVACTNLCKIQTYEPDQQEIRIRVPGSRPGPPASPYVHLYKTNLWTGTGYAVQTNCLLDIHYVRRRGPPAD